MRERAVLAPKWFVGEPLTFHPGFATIDFVSQTLEKLPDGRWRCGGREWVLPAGAERLRPRSAARLRGGLRCAGKITSRISQWQGRPDVPLQLLFKRLQKT